MHTDRDPEAPAAVQNDFDFMFGSWTVQHRRLKERLTDCDDWEEFPGLSHTQPILGSHGNVEDNYVELPGHPYRAIALRSFDPASGKWAIWWLDGRSPHRLDTPVKGRFTGDTGEFRANDVLNGQPLIVRFLWKKGPIPRWEQAFSTDDGATWETNWTMDFTPVA